MGINNVIFVGPFPRTHRVLTMNRKALELRETGLVTSFLHLVTGQNAYNFGPVRIHTTVQKFVVLLTDPKLLNSFTDWPQSFKQ